MAETFMRLQQFASAAEKWMNEVYGNYGEAKETESVSKASERSIEKERERRKTYI